MGPRNPLPHRALRTGGLCGSIRPLSQATWPTEAPPRTALVREAIRRRSPLGTGDAFVYAYEVWLRDLRRLKRGETSWGGAPKRRKS